MVKEEGNFHNLMSVGAEHGVEDQTGWKGKKQRHGIKTGSMLAAGVSALGLGQIGQARLCHSAILTMVEQNTELALPIPCMVMNSAYISIKQLASGFKALTLVTETSRENFRN